MVFFLNINEMKNQTLNNGKVESEAMKLTKKYIQDNLENPPTLNEISRFICQSESSLKRNFKATYGYSVYQFIQYSRVVKAKNLLDTGQYNIKQVAYQVGYSNTSHFSKAFKKHINVLPSLYINRVKMK